MLPDCHNGHLSVPENRINYFRTFKHGSGWRRLHAKRSTKDFRWTDQLFTEMFGTLLMTITAATTADWVDFWENEMTSSVDMNQEQIAAMLTVSENIQEGIEIAGELWELSDFEVTALCGIVADAFAEQGIKMEALV